jgi:prevent-host-death family protein
MSDDPASAADPSASSGPPPADDDYLRTTSITELRTDLTDLINDARDNDEAVLIESNHTPKAVLLSWSAYKSVNDAVDLGSL